MTGSFRFRRLISFCTTLTVFTLLTLGCRRDRLDVGWEHSARQVSSTVQKTKAQSPDVNRLISQLRLEIQKHPKSPGLHEQLSVLLRCNGDVQSAFSEIREAIRLAPDKPYYHASLAYLQKDAGLLQQSLRSFLKAVDLVHRAKQGTEWSPIYSMEAARLFALLGNKQRAESYYEKALSLHSAYRSEWVATGMDRRNRNDSFGNSLQREGTEQLRLLTSALAPERPTKTWLRREMPFLLTGHGVMGEEARIDLERKLNSGAISGAEPHLMLGMEYVHLGWENRAVIELLAVIELDPKNAVAWDELGWAYMWQGRLQQASRAIRMAEGLGSTSSGQLARRVDEAMARFRTSRKGIPAP